MRIRIFHETTYHYDQPPNGVIQTLRLTPRNHDGQFVMDWRIDVSQDCRLNAHEDAFGNITHAFRADGPFSELRVRVDGEVETQDTLGVVRGAVERFPPSLFLRDTPLTHADAAIVDFAADLRADGGEPAHVVADRAHDLEGRGQLALDRLHGGNRVAGRELLGEADAATVHDDRRHVRRRGRLVRGATHGKSHHRGSQHAGTQEVPANARARLA